MGQMDPSEAEENTNAQAFSGKNNLTLWGSYFSMLNENYANYKQQFTICVQILLVVCSLVLFVSHSLKTHR